MRPFKIWGVFGYTYPTVTGHNGETRPAHEPIAVQFVPITSKPRQGKNHGKQRPPKRKKEAQATEGQAEDRLSG
jgi:hypothetical protein